MDATMLKNIYPILKKYGFEHNTIQSEFENDLGIVVPLMKLVNILEDLDRERKDKIYTEEDL